MHIQPTHTLSIHIHSHTSNTYSSTNSHIHTLKSTQFTHTQFTHTQTHLHTHINTPVLLQMLPLTLTYAITLTYARSLSTLTGTVLHTPHAHPHSVLSPLHSAIFPPPCPPPLLSESSSQQAPAAPSGCLSSSLAPCPRVGCPGDMVLSGALGGRCLSFTGSWTWTFRLWASCPPLSLFSDCDILPL
jgi:hypothetical protein